MAVTADQALSTMWRPIRHLMTVLVLQLGCIVCLSPAAAEAIPRIEQRGTRHTLIVDGAPFLILGAQANNSSNYPAALPAVWSVIDRMKANTLEIPVAWEQIEPREGQFDFSYLDALLPQARERNVRLVLLWFATWKNTAPNYTPAWVRLDNQRFPRMINAKGETHYALSPHSRTTLEADKRAFVKLMEYLRDKDPQHTVIMVQVQNEPGTYGSVRDFGPGAQQLFEGPAPAALLKRFGRPSGQNWRSAFGADADEYFHAWHVASYINEIAAAGKTVLPLPMFVNAALASATGRQAASSYASGGPVHHVLDVYKVAAPAIDFLAPDIYQRDHATYMQYLRLYDRADNALFVPETGNDLEYARYFFPVIGLGGIGFAPFGMDDSGYFNYPLGARSFDGNLNNLGRAYAVFAPMMREWAQWAADGRTWGAAEPNDAADGHTQLIEMGRYRARITFGQLQFGWDKPVGNPRPTGGVAIAQLGADEYLLTGFDARIAFEMADARAGETMIYLRVEQGRFEAGKWLFERVWNGDQTDYGLNLTDRPAVLRVKLGRYRGHAVIPVGNPN